MDTSGDGRNPKMDCGVVFMLRFETAGESHGETLVTILTGLPAGVPVSLDFINRQLWRRQQGYGRGGRMKIETDRGSYRFRGPALENHRLADCCPASEPRLEELDGSAAC